MSQKVSESIRSAIAARLARTWRSRNAASASLLPFAWIYRLFVALRRWSYRAGLTGSRRVPCKVVVVGNISVGGSGKTPFTIWLARWLAERGFRPGVSVRGYRGRSKSWPLEVTATTPAREAGDEAVLVARNLDVPVAAGPGRGDACRLLVSKHRCDVVVCDDGLQHLALRRDFEIALVDHARGFGNGRLLPAGPLREPPARLRSVDFVVRLGTPESAVRPVCEYVYSLVEEGRKRPLESLRGRRVLAVAGIAGPERFFASLQGAGLEFEARVFPDHHRYAPADLESDAAVVVMTEKDAVKCMDFADARHWYLGLELEIAPRFIDDLASRLLPVLGSAA